MNKYHTIFALLTDFGTEDGYVGAMKGRLLSLAPGARLVDISHEIPPFDVRAGAFCLLNAYPYYPPESIFVCVVDPGVGTARHGMVLHTERYWFVGPDNGLFSLVMANDRWQAYRIRIEALQEPISPTFHGRDVFVPVAARIAAKRLEALLEPLSEPISFYQPPRPLDEHNWELEVLHVDHFGNVILNFQRQHWASIGQPQPMRLEIAGKRVEGPVKTFGEVPEGKILLNWDSSGFLQVAVNRGNAAQHLGVRTGQRARLRI